MYDITPTICIISYRLYKHSHTHLMTSHINSDITCTVLMSSPPHIWHCNHSIDDLCPTACMTPHPLYVWHLMHHIYRHIHALWTHPILVITLHPLHSWHHTHYTTNRSHENTIVTSAISPTISDATSTVSVSSNPGYQLYHTHALYDIKHTLCRTLYSVYMTSHKRFMTPDT